MMMFAEVLALFHADGLDGLPPTTTTQRQLTYIYGLPIYILSIRNQFRKIACFFRKVNWLWLVAVVESKLVFEALYRIGVAVVFNPPLLRHIRVYECLFRLIKLAVDLPIEHVIFQQNDVYVAHYSSPRFTSVRDE
jgi:hypothetical protein